MDCGGIVAGPVSKRQRVEFRGSGEDKISNLPGELITRILLLLPTHDVARTSILSKFWRNIWCPIFYFLLYITPAIRYCYHSWINQLSGKGLRTVNFLFEEKGATELSPALFGFPELTMLRLFNMALAPSFKSGSFTSLTIVQLVNTSIIHDMTFGKQLKYLHLRGCEGIERLARQFRKGNNLQGLYIAKSTKFEWQWLQRTRKLRYLGLVFTAANSEIRKVHDLIKLLGETPTLSRLILDGPTLKVLGPPPLNVSRPTAKAVNLRSLTLFWLKSHELCQFSRVAYLIRSFPHLQDLCIQLELDQVKSLSPTELTTEQYLGSLDWKDMFLDQLQTVKIKGAVDSRYVLCFIKHLLASSPSLKGISVFCSTKSTDTKEKLRIEQELQQFPRLSLDAQIICQHQRLNDPTFTSENLDSSVKVKLRPCLS
ncbi:hypothetical protein POM88_027823 [Heracleum sosnowskyi]|uniref:F-box domain-containing protein n=1 Tax=Heracleum sosnowskyi TaxID=360622 RepID=A0AAD8MQI4_9APIA|nr:hypothetical protein POM88_027823 [Heracleum sosnowskyi]